MAFQNPQQSECIFIFMFVWHRGSIQFRPCYLFVFRRRPDKYLHSGRAIQWLVALHDRIEDLVNKGDHCACLELEGDTTANPEELGGCLKWWCTTDTTQAKPPVSQLQTALEMDSISEVGSCSRLARLQSEINHEGCECIHVSMSLASWPATQLNKAVDCAHSDDSTGLKMVVVDWLMGSKPTPELALESRRKEGRGFYHNTTGWLICPVEYDWSNAQYAPNAFNIALHGLHHICRHRASIHGFNADYTVTADSWPCFLYKNKQYDPNNPVNGLFKNDLLVQVGPHYSLPLRVTFLTSHRPSNISSLPRAQLIPKMWPMTLIKKKELQWNHLWNVRRVWVRNTPEPMLLPSLGWSWSNLVRSHTQLCR